MKLFNTFLLSANCQVNYDRDVRACTQSTSYVGPDNFQYDLKNVLRTATPVPEATEMKLNFGRVPEWINGHWFRTGPGIYEFGDDEYMGLADPLAIWSRITFDQGSVTFKSDFQYGSHHTRNAEVGSIMFPEMSTWGNPADCDAENDPDNSKLIEFLTEDPDFVSDNNYVSYWAVGGGLYASGETYFVWQIDPITLKGVRKINLSELFQETVFKNNRKYNAKIGHTRCTSLATHLAHYHYDKVTDEYFGAFTCMTDGFVPGIEYVFYKIPDAFQGLKSKPETPEEVWGRAVIIGQVPSKHNSAMHLDFGQEYFHDFAITENYIIFGTTGILIDFLKMPELMITRTPLAYGAAFYEEAECSWYVMDRKSGEIKEYPTTPFFATHVMNAFEQEGKVILDTTHSDNANQFSTVWFANLTGNPEEMKDIYHHVSPVQLPKRFEFDLTKDSSDEMVKGSLLNKLGALPTGGADFPVINYERSSQHEYRNIWMNGFREVFNVDSIYRLDTHTGETVCRFMDGYVPSETKFIGSPNALREEDGVIVTLWSPLTKENKPLMHILDPMSLSVIAELELPVDYLPIGLHGLFFEYEE